MLAAPGRHPRPRAGIRSVPATATWSVSGVTKDSTGALLGDCVVKLFRTLDDVLVATTTSDAVGAFTFNVPGNTYEHYVVAYKASAPDVAGVSVNTILAT